MDINKKNPHNFENLLPEASSDVSLFIESNHMSYFFGAKVLASKSLKMKEFQYSIQNILYFHLLGKRARTQRFVFGKTIFAKAKGSALDF